MRRRPSPAHKQLLRTGALTSKYGYIDSPYRVGYVHGFVHGVGLALLEKFYLPI